MRSFLAALLLTLAGCSSYSVQHDQRYETAPFGSFDVYWPDEDPGPKGLPAIVAIHGGAWRSGSKADMEPFARMACAHGYVVLAPDYRLSIDTPQARGAPWPAQIVDCQTALRYFRQNAKALGIDPERIGAFGVSAGAHLATMLALRDDEESRGPRKGRVVCTFECEGEHDMKISPPEKIMADAVPILTDVLGHGPPWSDAELTDLSTVTFAREDAAVFVMHADRDPNVFPINAIRLKEALEATGKKPPFLMLTGDQGFCHGSCWMDAEGEMFRFFDAFLSP